MYRGGGNARARHRETGRAGRHRAEGRRRRAHAVGRGRRADGQRRRHRRAGGRGAVVGRGRGGGRGIRDIAAHVDGIRRAQALVVDGDLLAAGSGGHARRDGVAAGDGLIAAGGLELEHKARGADGVADGVGAISGQALDAQARHAPCLLHSHGEGAGLAHEAHGDGLVAGVGEIGGAAGKALAHVEVAPVGGVDADRKTRRVEVLAHGVGALVRHGQNADAADKLRHGVYLDLIAGLIAAVIDIDIGKAGVVVGYRLGGDDKAAGNHVVSAVGIEHAQLQAGRVHGLAVVVVHLVRQLADRDGADGLVHPRRRGGRRGHDHTVGDSKGDGVGVDGDGIAVAAAGDLTVVGPGAGPVGVGRVADAAARLIVDFFPVIAVAHIPLEAHIEGVRHLSLQHGALTGADTGIALDAHRGGGQRGLCLHREGHGIGVGRGGLAVVGIGDLADIGLGPGRGGVGPILAGVCAADGGVVFIPLVACVVGVGGMHLQHGVLALLNFGAARDVPHVGNGHSGRCLHRDCYIFGAWIACLAIIGVCDLAEVSPGSGRGSVGLITAAGFSAEGLPRLSVPHKPLIAGIIGVCDHGLQSDTLPLLDGGGTGDAHRRVGQDECRRGRIGRGGVLLIEVDPGLLDNGLLLGGLLGLCRLFRLDGCGGRLGALVQDRHTAQLDGPVPEDEEILARLPGPARQVEVVRLAVLVGLIELRFLGGRLARPFAADLFGDPNAVPAVGHTDLFIAHLGLQPLGQGILIEDHGVLRGFHEADLALVIHHGLVEEDEVFQLEAAAGKVDVAFVGVDHTAQAQARAEAGEPLGREGQLLCQRRGRERQQHQQRQRQGDPFLCFHVFILSESRPNAGLSQKCGNYVNKIMAQKPPFVNIIPAWEFVPFNFYDARHVGFVPKKTSVFCCNYSRMW